MDDLKCIKCDKIFSCKSSLILHSKSSKSCGTDSYNCSFCDKKFTRKQNLELHLTNSCEEKKKEETRSNEELKAIIIEKDKIIEENEKKFKEQEEYYNKLIVLETMSKEKIMYRETIEKLERTIEGLHEKILTLENKDHKIKIKVLEDKVLKRQPRVDYKEKNVVYILTSENHKKNRTYICGKAKNLTTRLSTYNKTEDFEVVYFRECKTEDQMGLVEQMFFNKLGEYRKKANREQFILPEGEEIDFFQKSLDECVKFFN